ncbi:Small-conductance mechanosensitive channel [Micromonospora phaseoli]|uniref:Small-conductance mechanosensitive channel n=1 Tax=Micromonospora phaseoli TaxID=1144548 RepID=A0A1H6Z988_9ACTN|nr:mechanosensitive ion channel family protein [Micromonospora phaseoli]PZW00495.1 small-conductance mechanosensitive channel [Micromonospora phaseoli]GIJ80944.1 mechanosensitive ion channel protein MscS [Micromonospora phaseoli]SEJ46232.1 Small-conductance mechanosensitive channel [Micromonospora phaseoli]
MDAFLDAMWDTRTVTGRLVTSIAMIVVAVLLAIIAGRLSTRRVDDAHNRYYLRKALHYVTVAVLLIGLAVLWRPFAGRIGLVVGLAAVGLALAMQEVIGAFAGWISILTGRQYRVGDRIQMCGVRGDVLDITPLRTRILESGSSTDPESWIRGRQYTGRVVSLSNRFVFTTPVYNSSTVLDHLWEELTLPIPYQSDWHLAERILHEEAESTSATAEAQRAISQMRHRYPVAEAEVDARVFVRATPNWVELTARFVVPVRSARQVKDQVTRRVLDRLAEHGLRVASVTQDITVHPPARANPTIGGQHDDPRPQ